MSTSIHEIPSHYKIVIQVYDKENKLHAYGKCSLNIFSERKVTLVFLLEEGVRMFKEIDLDFKEFPKDYKVHMQLMDEKHEILGSAKMGMDFIEARKEHYNECGLEFNLSEIWKGYCANLKNQENHGSKNT